MDTNMDDNLYDEQGFLIPPAVFCMNMLNAADASRSLRTCLSHHSVQDSDNSDTNDHHFNGFLTNLQFTRIPSNTDQVYQTGSNSRPIDQTFSYNYLPDNVESKENQLNETSPNNIHFNQVDQENHHSRRAFEDCNGFGEPHPANHQTNEVHQQEQHLSDVTQTSEEADTLGDKPPKLKRRRTEDLEPSYMTLAREDVSNITLAAQESLVSKSTDRSPRYSASTVNSSRYSASTVNSSRFSASTGRSSLIPMYTGRSSKASMALPNATVDQATELVPTATDHSSRAPMAPANTPADQVVEDAAYKYKCLVCHMGEGCKRKPYGRQEGSMPDEQVSVNTPGFSASANQGRASKPPPPKDSWNTQNLLKKHIEEKHVFFFKRTNSSEYVCSFCPCSMVSKRVNCGGRYPTQDTLVQHVSSAHHQIPSVRVKYDHLCAPLHPRSYPQKLFDALTRRDGSALH